MNDDLDLVETPGFWLGVLAFTIAALGVPVALVVMS